ncbi:MAG: hypothetical protein E7A50_07605 [Clostridiales bacterium]|nr:hypothetical protein [Clostridiales bacterium]
MKQVTMESVKQRIADLESAGKIVGGLSLSSEFELACLRELVAVTEQRDAVVAENAVLIDLARKFADRADDYKGSLMGFSVFESFNELKSAGSKEATSSAIAALRAEGRNQARKEGAIFAANRMLAAWDAGFVEDTPENVADIARAILSMTEFMDDAPEGDFDRSFADEMIKAIARQLRESKGANHE